MSDLLLLFPGIGAIKDRPLSDRLREGLAPPARGAHGVVPRGRAAGFGVPAEALAGVLVGAGGADVSAGAAVDEAAGTRARTVVASHSGPPVVWFGEPLAPLLLITQQAFMARFKRFPKIFLKKFSGIERSPP